MPQLDVLTTVLSHIDLTDSCQYLNNCMHPINVPNNIRVFLRERKASELGKAIHNRYMLVINLKTTAHIVINKEKSLLEPGHAFLIPPNTLHEYDNISQSDVNWLFISFHIDTSEDYHLLHNSAQALSESVIKDLEALLSLNVFDASENKKSNAASELQFSLRLKLILEQLNQSRYQQLLESGTDHTQEAETAGSLVKGACKYISTHIEKVISIEDIAQSLFVSPGHLRNEFQRHMGASLGKYVRYMKMNNACILLDTTELGLNEIAERCGYSSIFSFSRAFKKEKGTAPSTYRKMRQSYT